MDINFIDLRTQYAGNNYMDLMNIVRSGQFVGSESFEARFANYHGSKHCVGVGSGTDALLLALLALEIGPGDKVIVPANTFIATPFAVSHTGAEPVFCDVDPDGYFMTNETLADIEITDDIKAIIPVHMYGMPCRMPSIMQFADKHGLYVIEDCAQAIGAEVFNKKVGTWGEIGCFSFYPTKNLGGLGQGGAIITDSEQLLTTISELGNVGRTDGEWDEYSHIGYNSRLDAINAKFLEINLRFLDQWNGKRIKIANQYERELEELAHAYTAAPPVPNIVKPVYHLYELQIESKKTRTWLMKYLNKNGIPARLHNSIPCHKQVMYKHMNAKCPTAERLADTLLSLPMHPYMTPEEVTYICDHIKTWYARRK